MIGGVLLDGLFRSGNGALLLFEKPRAQGVMGVEMGSFVLRVGGAVELALWGNGYARVEVAVEKER